MCALVHLDAECTMLHIALTTVVQRYSPSNTHSCNNSLQALAAKGLIDWAPFLMRWTKKYTCLIIVLTATVFFFIMSLSFGFMHPITYWIKVYRRRESVHFVILFGSIHLGILMKRMLGTSWYISFILCGRFAFCYRTTLNLHSIHVRRHIYQPKTRETNNWCSRLRYHKNVSVQWSMCNCH